MNQRPDRADRRSGGGLRPPDDHLRRRLHRRLQPDAGTVARAARGRGRARQAEVQVEHRRRRLQRRGALPRGGAAREARDRLGRRPRRRPSVEGLVESSLYLGTSTQLIVDLGEGGADDGSRAERRRGRAPALPGGGAKVQLSWAPEHMHVVRESRTTGASPSRRRPKRLEQRQGGTQK